MKLFDKVAGLFGYVKINAVAHGDIGWHGMVTNGFGNAAKEKVTNETALTVSTLFACVRNVSEDIGKMPLKVYRKEGEYRHEEANHPAARILQYQPNPEMTAISFREAQNAQMMGWGNAYAEIQFDLDGKPQSLWPLRPDRITMYREDGTNHVFYRILNDGGGAVDLWAENVLHLHGLGFDGIKGYNIIQYASQLIGAAIGTDKFAGSFFPNGLHQSGILIHPENLSAEAQKRLKNQLSAEYGGGDNANKTLVLEEGMSFVPTSVDPKASQMIETRQFTVSEFCRWMRVPPHKVADLSRATFSNIEEQNIDYVQDGLLGWCERWEQALWWKLLTPAEKNAGYYFEHVVEGLLRGNVKARYEAYSQLWDRGVITINEIRAKENMNPVDGGDVHYVPLNFAPLGSSSSDTAVNSIANDIAKRLASRETKELAKYTKHAAEDMGKFHERIKEFYERHDKYISDAIIPLAESLSKSVSIDMLSLKPYMLMTNVPVFILEQMKSGHVNYIANNLKGYLI